MKITWQQTIISPALALTLSSIATTPGWVQTVSCANPQTTSEISICAEREYRAADQKLNQVYRQLQSRLSRKQQQSMTTAQLAWIKFRDANCDYQRGQFAGGSLASSVNTSCLTGMTQQRTQELAQYLQEIGSR